MEKQITLLFCLLISLNALRSKAQTCSGTQTFTTCTGAFNDGSGASNYSNNLNCSYLIQPSSAATITVNFSSFSTELSYDILHVYDGANASAPLIGSYSGSLGAFSFTSTASSVFMVFTSDANTVATGWSLSYTCALGLCNGINVLNSCTGTFTDGSGASNYANNMSCIWSIDPPGTQQVQVTFSQFNTQAGTDGIFVYDQNNNLGPALNSWSGNSIPPAFTSSNGALTVQFNSNSSVTAPGFTANYSCVSNLCSGTTTITNCSGTLEDGSGTGFYQNNRDCRWIIQPPGANYISVHFNSFQLQSSWDYLEIHDGASISSPLIGSFYGTNIPADFTSSSGALYLKFYTNGDDVERGWSLNYSCNNSVQCSGQTVLTNCSGILDDGSGTNNYANNQNCSWLIQPPGASNVTLHFNSFNLHSSDHLTVYDGNSTSAPSLGSFSGAFPPADIPSTSGSMYVVFTSNATQNQAGFDCSYSCNIASVAEINEPLLFSLFPNPNSGDFNLMLDFKSPAMVSLSMINVLGKLVKKWEPQFISNHHVQKIEADELATGVYDFIVETNGKMYHQPIAIIKK